MKKYSILYVYILFPLLMLAVGITSCTDDTIMMNSGKLPDEVAMGTIGSTLRSNSSFSGKTVIELTKDSEDEIVVDEIFYKLSRPATSEVKVTVRLETEMSMEFEEEIKADNAKILAFNESMVAAHWRQKPLLKSAVFPAENVLTGEGVLTVPAGKEQSSSIKLTLSTHNLPIDYDVYELFFIVEQTNADGEMEKQSLRYRVNVRQKADDMTFNDDGRTVTLDSRFLSVFYLNTSTYQPILADIFIYTRTNNTTYNIEEVCSLGNIVNLRIATIGYDKDSGRALLELNNDLRYVLENVATYIRPLQDHGRKVCLCIEGGGKGLGFCNMNDAQIADFTRQVKDAIELYQLDGVNLWDRNSGYGKTGMSPMNTTSYPKLIKSLHDVMSDKMLTLVDKDEPTATFYDPTLCNGIEVGRYIDYAWHGYINEEEKVQIIEPWEADHPYSEYTRKPIAGLSAERYGSINIPLYPSIAKLMNDSYKNVILWKKDGNRKKNNIIVFGSDMISDEQNQYEYGMKNRFLDFVGSVADDGLDWGKISRPPFEGKISGEFAYMIQVTKAHQPLFDAGYRYLAKDW